MSMVLVLEAHFKTINIVISATYDQSVITHNRRRKQFSCYICTAYELPINAVYNFNLSRSGTYHSKIMSNTGRNVRINCTSLAHTGFKDEWCCINCRIHPMFPDQLTISVQAITTMVMTSY